MLNLSRLTSSWKLWIRSSCPPQDLITSYTSVQSKPRRFTTTGSDPWRPSSSRFDFLTLTAALGLIYVSHGATRKVLNLKVAPRVVLAACLRHRAQNIPPDNVVRLSQVRIGLKLRELLGLSDSTTFLVRTFLKVPNFSNHVKISRN